MSGDALLRAGLAPLDGDEGQSVSARTYHHPGLAEPVVRLTGDRVALAEDRTMAFLGYGEPEVSEPLSRAELQGLNYPTWALVHDPDNAAAALATLPELEQAAKKAVTSPEAALSIFTAAARSLPQTHLPSFWEQAGRLFLGADRAHYAGRMFSKARDIETTYALPVEESLRQAVFVEFALAGAVTVKALSAYLSELKSRYTPEEAFVAFERVVLGRIRGGQPPWTTLLDQWRGLAADAGRDADEETRRLLAAILDAPSMSSAPTRFWTLAMDSLLALAESSAEHRRTLLWLFPKKNTYERSEHIQFLEEWLGLLDRAGALRDLVGSDDAGPWLHRVITVLRDRRYCNAAPPRLLALLPDLKATCGTIDLAHGGDSWRARYVNVDILAECLKLGIPVSDPMDDVALDLRDWVEDAAADIAPLAADDRWRRVLYSALDDAASGVIGHEKLSSVIGGWLSEHARTARAGGIADLDRSMPRLGAVDVRRHSEVLAEVERLDAAAVLRRTIRAGLVQETHWPAYREAMGELAIASKSEITVESCWPYAVLHNDRLAIAIGPEGRVGEHTPQWPTGHKRDNVVLYVGGQFFVAWSKDYTASYSYWSSDPSRVVTNDEYWFPGQHSSMGYTMLQADGFRLGHSDVLRVGDRMPNSAWDFLCDGATFWAQYRSNDLVKVDPATGAFGDSDRPAFLVDGDDGYAVQFGMSSLAPWEGTSPLGHADGLIGTRVSADGSTYRVTSIDGRSVTIPRRNQSGPWGLMTLPGRPDAPVVLDHLQNPTVVDAEGRRHSTSHVRSAGVPPVAYWHCLTPKDESVSKRLAELDEATAEALLAAGRTDNAAKPEKDEPPHPACDAVLDDMGVTDSDLRLTIVELARSAARSALRIERLLAPDRPTVTMEDCGIDHDELAQVLEGAVDPVWNRGECRLADQLIAVDAFLRGRLDPAVAAERGNDSGYPMERVLAGAPMLALRASSPGFTDGERTAATGLLKILSTSILVVDEVSRGDAKKQEDAQYIADDNGALFTFLRTWEDGDYVNRYLVVGSPTTPFALDAKPLVKGWTTEERLALALENLPEDGVVAITDEAIEAFIERTDVPRSVAILVLSGLPRVTSYARDYLGRERREALGLSVGHAELGKMWLRGFDTGAIAGLYTSAATEDPAILWDVDRRAEVLGDAWFRRFGAAPRITDEDVAEASGVVGQYWVREALLFLADPRRNTSASFAAGNGIAILEHLGLWAVTGLPEGHPLRANVPEATAILRARARAADLLSIGNVSRSLIPVELTTSTPVKVDGINEKAIDLGALVLRPVNDYVMEGYVRYGRVAGDSHEALIRTFDNGDVLERRDWLFGDAPDAVAARSGAIPEGRYDTDPTASAPELVERVAEHLDLDADAAALYLQLLALPNPTDKNVRQWNDWKPKRHKTATAALVERGLVIEAKRARAGRKVFLPGGWEANTSSHPYETWKSDMYRDSWIGVAHAPCPELFATAWERVASGEGPR